jgi:hypothetical protein
LYELHSELPQRQDHPSGNSSLTFAFATLVTHSIFCSDPSDWTINATSSYLDLSPLYGISAFFSHFSLATLGNADAV